MADKPDSVKWEPGPTVRCLGSGMASISMGGKRVCPACEQVTPSQKSRLVPEHTMTTYRRADG